MMKVISHLKTIMQSAVIDTIQWGVRSSEDIKRTSAVHVTEPHSTQKGATKIGGVNDPRMGATAAVPRCGTCAYTAERCTGHHGHIEFPLPVVNCEFLKQLHPLLSFTCYDCARAMISPDDPRLRVVMQEAPRVRMKGIKLALTNPPNVCPHCGYGPQPKWVRDKNDIFLTAEFKVTGEEEEIPTMTPMDLYHQLCAIPDEDLIMMGYNPADAHPKNYLWMNFLVPQPCMRPSKNSGGGTKSEDDLTAHLKGIVRASNDLKQYGDVLHELNMARYNGLDSFERVQNASYRHDQTYLNAMLSYRNLYRAVAVYENGDLTEKTMRGEKPKDTYGAAKRSIRDRNKQQKRSRLRLNILGKRIRRIGRSVIGPEPYITIDEVGMPIKHCMRITYPERVTLLNIRKLTERVRNGPKVYPGANFLTRDGRRYDLSDQNGNSVSLKIGDVVDRHMDDTDVVIGNRQPTLHKSGMQAHRVCPMPHNTYRLNLGVTGPYNADFDGDEMNMMLVTNEKARAEALEFMLPSKNIVNYGAPQIGPNFHWMYGMYAIGEETFDRAQAMQLIMHGCPDREFPSDLLPYNCGRVPGRLIFSAVLPEVTFQRKDIKIENGVWLSGRLHKGNVMGQNGLIMAMVLQDLDVAEFLDRSAQMMNYWSETVGFSFRLSDCHVPLEFEDFGENNRTRDTAGDRTMAYMAEQPCNYLYNMVKSGTKGGSMNVCQISCMLGMQKDQFNKPFTQVGHPEGSSFVRGNFLNGLTPTEMFYHLRAGRIGVANTAISTARIGYRNRQCVKACETIMVRQDGSVRNSDGELVMASCGDGLCPSMVTRVPLEDTSEHPLMREMWREMRELYTTNAHWLERVNAPLDYADMRRRLALPKPWPDTEPHGTRQAVDDAWTRMPAQIKCRKIELHYRSNTLPEQMRGVQVGAYLDKIVERYHRARLQPGTPIGHRSAHSLTKVLMQKTLSQFHHAGEDSSVHSGLQKFKDIVYVKSKAKNNMVVFLEDGIDHDEFALGLVAKRLRNYVTECTTQGTIRFRLDKEACLRDLVSPRLLGKSLGAASWSALHDHEWELVFRPSGHQIAAMVEHDNNIVIDHDYVRDTVMSEYPEADVQTTSNTNVMVSLDNSAATGSPFDHAKHLRECLDHVNGTVEWKILDTREGHRNMSSKKTPEDFVLENMEEGVVMQMKIKYDAKCGNDLWMAESHGREQYARDLYAEDLESRVFHGYKEVTGYRKTQMFCQGDMRPCVHLFTEPIKVRNSNSKQVISKAPDFCLIDVLELPGVTNQTYSENILEMYRLFGIGSAYNTIVRELMQLYNFSFERQILVLASVMTHTGHVRAVTNNAVTSTNQHEVLKNAAFEKMCDFMASAGAKGSHDSCAGITASIVVAREGPLGTGSFETFTDPEYLTKKNGKRQRMLIDGQPCIAAPSEEDLRMATLDRSGARRKRTHTTFDFGVSAFEPAYPTFEMRDFCPAF